MKKIFSFLTLAAALLCSGNAWAGSGGSADDPIEISENIPSTYTFTAGKFYKLTTNVNCSTSITVAVNFIESDYTLTLPSNKTVSAGVYHCPVVLTGKTCKITGENTEFYKAVTCAGTQNNSYGIQQGTFHGVVTSSGYIMNGTFEGQVTSSYYIYGGTFKNTVTSSKYIYGGTFEKKVYSTSSSSFITHSTSPYVYPTFKDSVIAKSISGGVFHKGVKLNVSGGALKGGVFDSIPTFGTGASMPATHTMVSSNTTPYRYLVSEAKYVENEKVAQGSFLKYLVVGDFIDAASEVKEVQGNNYQYVLFKDDLKNDSLYKGAYLYNPHASLIAKGYSVAYAMNNKDTYQFSYYFIGKNATTMMYPGYSWGWQVLTGGTFEFDLTQYTDSCIHPDYEVKEIEKGKKWQVQLNEALTVAKIGENAYKSLTDALSSVKDGDIIKLMKNQEENVVYDNSSSGHDFTLDLNGKTLSSATGTTLSFDRNYTRTVTIVSNGGSVVANTTDGIAIKIEGAGGGYETNVTIIDGAYSGATVLSVNAGTMTINGGDFNGNLAKGSSGTYYITAGTFTVNPTTAVGATYPDDREVRYNEKKQVYEIKTATYYEILAGDCQHGSVQILGTNDEGSTKAGKQDTVIPYPDQNYKVAEVYTMDYDEMKEVIPYDTSNKGYFFTVTKPVTVYATFVEVDHIVQNVSKGNYFYETMEEALSAAAEGDTLVLLSDLAFSKNESWTSGKHNVVDLGGHTITFTGITKQGNSLFLSGYMTVQNGILNSDNGYTVYTKQFNPTVQTKENSDLHFVNLSTDGGFNMIKTTATFTNVNTDLTGRGTDFYPIYCGEHLGGDTINQITIKSGTFIAGGSSTTICIATPSVGTSSIVVEGGTFKGGYSVGTDKQGKTNSSLTIYGGSFSVDPTTYIATDYTKEKVADLWRVYKEEGIRPSVTLDKIGTICLDYNVEAGNYENATFYQIAYRDGDVVYFDQVDNLKAGYAYIFSPSATGEITYKMSGAQTTTTTAFNGLHGTLTGINTEKASGANDLTGKYLVSNNIIQKCGISCWLNANRAYIVWDEIPTTEPAQAPSRRISLSRNDVNTTTEFMNVNVNANANGKVMINGQLVIVKDGKMFNAQGARL